MDISTGQVVGFSGHFGQKKILSANLQIVRYPQSWSCLQGLNFSTKQSAQIAMRLPSGCHCKLSLGNVLNNHQAVEFLRVPKFHPNSP